MKLELQTNDQPVPAPSLSVVHGDTLLAEHGEFLLDFASASAVRLRLRWRLRYDPEKPTWTASDRPWRQRGMATVEQLQYTGLRSCSDTRFLTLKNLPKRRQVQWPYVALNGEAGVTVRLLRSGDGWAEIAIEGPS